MLKQCSINLNQIAEELNISNTVAHLLYVRGYKTKEDMRSFLNAQNTILPDYSLFKGMEDALKCINSAINNHKKITVFGDYDADGIMSTVILVRLLKNMGANIDYYIPDRESEGYGLNCEALKHLKEQGTDIILACDNGIAAIEQIAYAREIGLVTVIIDHHDVQYKDGSLSEYVLPQADALINPKNPECRYPFKQYCAGGLCYRFAEAVIKSRNFDWEKFADDFLVLAAIATVCDLVELKEDNRFIVKKGLTIIKNTNIIGLNALIKACGLQEKTISTYHIGYILGPCINASGRLMIAGKAVELFLSDDGFKAYSLAEELIALNNTRKEITVEGTESVLNYIENNTEIKNDKILVIYDENVQSSVAGIIAGKIKERYHKPVVMLAGDSDIIKGSCRSIEQYNIFEGLSSVRHLLEKFGGHPMAAGISIKAENIKLLRQEINDKCPLSVEDMQPVIHIDKALNIYNADLAMAEAISVLEPFGKGNEKPYFADKNVIIRRINIYGKNENIIKLNCYKNNNNKAVEVTSFYLIDKLFSNIIAAHGQERLDALLKGQGSLVIDLVYTIEINNYNDRLSAQLIMHDFRISG